MREEKNWNKIIVYCSIVGLFGCFYGVIYVFIVYYNFMRLKTVTDVFAQRILPFVLQVCLVVAICWRMKILQVNLSLAYFIVSKVLMTEWWRYQTEKHGKKIKIKHQSKIAANSANGTFCSSHILLYFQWNEQKNKCEKKDCCSLAVNREKKTFVIGCMVCSHTYTRTHSALIKAENL